MRQNSRNERTQNFIPRIRLSRDEDDLMSSVKSSMASLSLSRSMNVLDDMGMRADRRTKFKLKEGASCHDTGQSQSIKAASKLSLCNSLDFKEGISLRKRSSDTPSTLERKFLLRHRYDYGSPNPSQSHPSFVTSEELSTNQRDSLISVRNESEESRHTDNGNAFFDNKPTPFMGSDTDLDDKNEGKVRNTANIKLRHSSKSIPLNLNDINVCETSPQKKKFKRPLTTTSESVEILRVNSVKLNSGNNKYNFAACRTDWDVQTTEHECLPSLVPSKNCKTRSVDSSSLIGANCKSNGRKNCPCNKVQKMQAKLQAQAQLAKSLEEQNLCLASLMDQKKSLVEQLTKQVQMLVKENQKLSRRRPAFKCGPILPKSSPVEQQDSSTLTDAEDTVISLQDSQAPLQNPKKTFTETGTNPFMEESESEPGVKVPVPAQEAKPPTLKNESSGLELPETSTAYIGPFPSNVVDDSKLVPQSSELESWNSTCEAVQNDCKEVDKENVEMNRFLSDLLYTLNARGYESITDHDGNSIDLFRCKGEAFLELKGRDARLRAPVKRVAPHETLLKAVIGSQERIIQTLMSQLDEFQRYALAQGNTEEHDSEETSQTRRCMILEGEILSLFSLLEGVCQRNPAIYQVLRDQQTFDAQIKAHSGVTIGNAIVDLALERCKKAVSVGLPASTANSAPFSRPRRIKSTRALTPIARFPSQLVVTRGQVSRTSLHKEQKQDSIVAGIALNGQKIQQQDTNDPVCKSIKCKSQRVRNSLSSERTNLPRPTVSTSAISCVESIQQRPQPSDPP